MADPTLSSALSGLQYAPLETGWGIGAQGVAQALPSLVNPYANPLQNLGVTLGGALVASLLGYQAKKEAASNSLELMSYANQLQAMPAAQQRVDFIKGIDDAGYQSRLATLATALNTQELQAKQKLNEAVGLETGKMKALQDYYASPAGQSQREFELRKIKEEAEARRTPYEEWLMKQNIIQQGKETITGMTIEGKKDLQVMRDEKADARQKLELEAKSGDAEKQRQWKSEQNTIQQNFDREIVKFKLDAGVDAAVAKEKRVNDLRMENIRSGESADLAEANAKAQVLKETQTELLQIKDDMSRKRLQEYNQAVEDRMKVKKQLEQEYPNVPAKVREIASDAPAFGNLAKDLAADIRKISSYPEFRGARNMAAIGDQQLNSRMIDIADRLVRARSGMATRGAEDEKIEKIALGDLTVGPEEAATILERVANDTMRVAADRLSAATQSPVALANMLREAADTNSKVTLEPRMFSSGAPVGGTNLSDLENRLRQLQERRKQLEKQKGVK
jgi:hypothetical protein